MLAFGKLYPQPFTLPTALAALVGPRGYGLLSREQGRAFVRSVRRFAREPHTPMADPPAAPAIPPAPLVSHGSTAARQAAAAALPGGAAPPGAAPSGGAASQGGAVSQAGSGSQNGGAPNPEVVALRQQLAAQQEAAAQQQAAQNNAIATLQAQLTALQAARPPPLAPPVAPAPPAAAAPPPAAPADPPGAGAMEAEGPGEDANSADDDEARYQVRRRRGRVLEFAPVRVQIDKFGDESLKQRRSVDTFIEDLIDACNLPADATAQELATGIARVIAAFTSGQVREWWRSTLACWRQEQGLPLGQYPLMTWERVREAMNLMAGNFVPKEEQALLDLARGAFKQSSGQTVAQYITAFTNMRTSLGPRLVPEPAALVHFIAGLRAPLDKICETNEQGKPHGSLAELYRYALAKERELGPAAPRVGAARVQGARRGQKAFKRARREDFYESPTQTPSPPARTSGGFQSHGRHEEHRTRRPGRSGGDGAGPSHRSGGDGAGPSHRPPAAPSGNRGRDREPFPNVPGVGYNERGDPIIMATSEPACFGCLRHGRLSAFTSEHRANCKYGRRK